MKKTLSNSNLSSQHQRQDTLYEISSVDDFYEILERERARADRSNQRLSLLVFELGLPDVDGDIARHLVSVLVSRLRISDDIGWFDRQSIGIILPYTSAEGAWKLAEEVCKGFKGNGRALSSFCSVYTYPFEKHSSDDNSEKFILTRV